MIVERKYVVDEWFFSRLSLLGKQETYIVINFIGNHDFVMEFSIKLVPLTVVCCRALTIAFVSCLKVV